MAASFSTQSNPTPVRILIVDDSRDLLSSLQFLLETIEGVEVVGSAPDGVAALEQVEALRPDVLLMDIEMPRMSGLQATRVLRERAIPIGIVLMSIHFGDEMLQVCRAYGADSFISKVRLSPHELERQLKQLTPSPVATITR